jgi:hypothetical protein
VAIQILVPQAQKYVKSKLIQVPIKTKENKLLL